MVINTSEIIPEFTFDKVINSSKTERITHKLDKLEYWYMMGYFMGDGWIEETTRKDGRTRNIIKFAINDRDEEEVYVRFVRWCIYKRRYMVVFCHRFNT
jgi:hypothetical protein